jgi:hypothetical protein
MVIPTILLGSEIPQKDHMVSTVQENPSRGDDAKGSYESKGYVVLGAGDDLKMVGHDAGPYKFSSEELDKLRDDIYRTVAHMGASASNSAGRARQSGDAKKQDLQPETKLLYAFANKLSEFAIRIYNLIADVRDEDVVWQVHGLNEYEEVDRETLIKEAAGVDAVTIHSSTFRKAYELDLAKKLLGPLSPSTLEAIQKEIDEGVTEEREQHLPNDLETRTQIEET